MKRQHLHLIVDAGLFLSVLGLVLTGLLMTWVLPPGSRAASVWSWTRHEWGDVHFWLAMTMLGIALLHVALNWGWVCSVALRLVKPRGALMGQLGRHLAGAALVAALAVVIGGFLWAAGEAKVADLSGGRQGGGHRHLLDE